MDKKKKLSLTKKQIFDLNTRYSPIYSYLRNENYGSEFYYTRKFWKDIYDMFDSMFKFPDQIEDLLKEFSQEFIQQLEYVNENYYVEFYVTSNIAFINRKIFQ